MGTFFRYKGSNITTFFKIFLSKRFQIKPISKPKVFTVGCLLAQNEKKPPRFRERFVIIYLFTG